MTYKLGKRSKKRLEGVHPDLVVVLKLAVSRSKIDFTVLEGLRSLKRQKELKASGASKTLNSRHLTGHAVDIAPLLGGKVSWDWPLYYQLEPVVKKAAKDLGVEIEWGGDWKSFKDGPHWQLPWSVYGKGDMAPRQLPRGDIRPPSKGHTPTRPPTKKKTESWLSNLFASFRRKS